MNEKAQIIEIAPSFAIQLEEVPVDAEAREEIVDLRPPHVLICIHGIRDDGAWCDVNATAPGRFAETKIEIVCVRYDRLSSPSFLLGLNRARINTDVIDQIKFIQGRFPDSMFSVLCHSNGTKVLSEIIEHLPRKIEWIFLCGSVCHLNDVRQLRNINRRPVNDAAVRDWWPIFAEVFRPSLFQATGVNGFHKFPVMDRMFPYDHGGGISRAHVEEWILPILSTSAVRRTEMHDLGFRKHMPTYIRRTLVALAALMVWVICRRMF